ncbi:MAG: type II toxin-antitoxin system death-on-curing family toxin [Candidatus Coproplasma sp.]
MIWLTKEQVIYLHSELIASTGGHDGLRDDNLLQSALLSPMQTYDSKELFPTIIDKAARLACGLTQNHPFIDGNKRIGAHAMLVILALNGISLSYSQKELSDVFLQLAADEVSFEELRSWVYSHIKKDEP